jgi:mannose-6-phosphate isomerase-like protein (cupin superfamily)
MNKPPYPRGQRQLTRRDSLLFGASALALAALGKAGQSDMPGEAPVPSYAKDSEVGSWRQYDAIHAGKGSVNIKRFPFGGDSAPANFIIYEIPPGASEGVHVHYLDDRNELGAFDEYYYVISGQGQMEINGALVAVTAGDHVHTPLDVRHGIENTDPHEHLKVFLTFINRAIKS